MTIELSRSHLRSVGETSAPETRHKLLRVAWLQHRGACLALFAVLVAFAVAIVVERTRIEGSYAAFVANGCVGHQLAGSCNTDALGLGGQSTFTTIGYALSALPLLVGVFVGAPLVSREIESGTFRFAWTQATPRSRLVLATLGALGGGVAAMSVVLGLLFGGWYAHVYYVVLAPIDTPWQATQFVATWWMLAVWTVMALSFGALLGTLVRRTVPAMATTAVLVGGLIVGAREVHAELLHLGASATRIPFKVGSMVVGAINAPSQPGWHVPSGSWLVRSWMTGPHGAVLSTSQSTRVLRLLGASTMGRVESPHQMALHHASYWVSYQPPGHFWMAQGIEGAVVLVIAAVCVLATVRVLGRRAVV